MVHAVNSSFQIGHQEDGDALFGPGAGVKPTDANPARIPKRRRTFRPPAKNIKSSAATHAKTDVFIS